MSRKWTADSLGGLGSIAETIVIGGLACGMMGCVVGCESPESGEREPESVSEESEKSESSVEPSQEESAQRAESAETSAPSNPAGPCSEPPTCPEPDESKPPEVTCHEPTSVAIGRRDEESRKERQKGLKAPPKMKMKNSSAQLHIFGRRLVREDGPPVLVVYRPASKDGRSGQVDTDVEVESPCHVVATLGLSSPMVQQGGGVGSALEFRLLREQPTEEQREADDLGAIATDWREIELTE